MTLTAPAAEQYGRNLQEAKEAMADALVNLTVSHCSGEGLGGEFVYARPPHRAFVSQFLLPRFDSTGVDETTDIHISVVGIDTQIKSPPSGLLVVRPSFSVYVRVLPEWAELQDERYALKPIPRLKEEYERQIKEETKKLYQKKLEQTGLLGGDDKSLPKDKRTERRLLRLKLRTEARREVLKALGIEPPPTLAAQSPVTTSQRASDLGDALPEPPLPDVEPRVTEPEQSSPAEPGQGPINASGYPLYMLRDLDIPQKWRRVRLQLPSFTWELSSSAVGLADALKEHSRKMSEAIRQQVQTWLQSPEGQRESWRNVKMRPEHWQSESSWNGFLRELRTRVPELDELLTKLDETQLYISLLEDFADSSRLSLRVALENNNRDVLRPHAQYKCPALFQVHLAVSLPAALHQPLRLDRVEPSYRFRSHMLYPAMGLNCGVLSRRQDDSIVLETTWAPRWVQPRTVPRNIEVPTRFHELASPAFDIVSLRRIPEEYLRWVDEQERALAAEVARGLTKPEADAERERFAHDVKAWRQEAELIARGIAILEESKAVFDKSPAELRATPWRSFILMNQSFLGRENGSTKAGWRLFQLAFVLAHVPCIASRMPEFELHYDPEMDEHTASLLYFPTGGGKSEAFYGTLVFAMFLDRLRGKLRGVTSLVRYPLRLLTLQQAQRLLRLLIRAEIVRKKEGIAGWPFEIGFWVGSANTPNRASDMPDAIPDLSDIKYPDDRFLEVGQPPVNEDFSRAYLEAKRAYNKIPRCPICKSATGLRMKQGGDSNGKRAAIVCFNGDCAWNQAHPGQERTPLPFLLTDDTIYHRAPSVILGTVDKLAMLGQHPETIAKVLGMFGAARWVTDGDHHLLSARGQDKLRAGPVDCQPIFPAYASGERLFYDPFPSLVIQDEMHLLEESLGTFAGLFETLLEAALRRLSESVGDKLRVARAHRIPERPVRMPKVIAATATVSDPERQLEAIYQRKALLFPMPGPDLHRSFFAQPEDPPHDNADRLAMQQELGKDLAPESTSPWMRLYVSLMTNGGNHTTTTVAVLSAFHLQVTRLWRMLNHSAERDTAARELLSAISPGREGSWRRAAIEEIIQARRYDLLLALLDLHRVSITYVTNKKGGDQVIDALDQQVRRDHEHAGLALASFPSALISGGVDISQIQEVMRQAEDGPNPGQPYPEITSERLLRNVVATSAISHGVDVERFNSMFFAGLPSNVAEYIQASSRVGRTHVGFVMLVPTPQSRRDRYVVETHDIFHRFLERMIDPPAVERWADNALVRAMPSVIQAWAMLGETEEFTRLPDDRKYEVRPHDIIESLHRKAVHNAIHFQEDLTSFSLSAFGFSGRGPQGTGRPHHQSHYRHLIEQYVKRFVDAIKQEPSHAKLDDLWKSTRYKFMKPMTSLRDIEEAGHVVARLFERGGGSPTEIKAVMDVIRGQRAVLSEADEGVDSLELKKEVA